MPSSITPKFAIGDTLYTCLNDRIIECVVVEINIKITDGPTIITNNVNHLDNGYAFTDTVSFTTAADCATYLQAHVEANV